MTLPLTLTLRGETLGDIIDQMRFLLDTVKTDEGRELLARMHEDLPPAVRRPPKDKQKGAAPTRGEVEASLDASAPPCFPDDVRRAMRDYLARFGDVAAEEHLPTLIGASRVSDVAPEKLWRAKRAIEAAITSGQPAGPNPKRS